MWRERRRWRRAHSALLFSLLGTLLAGCSVGISSARPPTATPGTLPSLRLERITEIPSVYEELRATNALYIEVIGSVGARLQAGITLPATFWYSTGSHLYAFNLDGGSPRAVVGKVPCTFRDFFNHALTADGRWLVCMEGRVVWQIELQDDGSSSPQARAVALQIQGSSASWSADGLHLYVTDPPNGICTLAIYETTPEHQIFTLTRSLAFPPFATQTSKCVLFWANESPDGRYLALTASEQSSTVYYALPLARVPAAPPSGDGPPTVTISGDLLQRIGPFQGNAHETGVWTSDSKGLLFNDGGERVIEVNLEGGRHIIQLEVPFAGVGAELCRIGAIPGDTRIAFTYCAPTRSVSGPRSRLFLLTPVESS